MKGKANIKETGASVSGDTIIDDVVIPHVLVIPVASKRKRKDKYDEPLEDFLEHRKNKKQLSWSCQQKKVQLSHS